MVASARTRRREAGDADGDHDGSPERTCIVTRVVLPPEELIRFVADLEGRVVPDVSRRLPGRGVWVTCSRAAVADAVRGKAFSRGLKRATTADADLADLVEHLLARRVLDALSLANKAGLVTTGFTKVDMALERGLVALLLRGSDAATDGADKLERRFKAVSEAMGRSTDDRAISVLSIAELSLAMGRPNVVHAALAKGGAADNFQREALRLQRYRALPVGAREARPT